VALVGTTILSCAGWKRDGPPNIVWIVWDTVRADRLGLYGGANRTTPFLDEWAKEARIFEDCVSPSNYTLASHASLFTGLLPSEHGVRNGDPRLPADRETIAELLRGAGYRTYLYSANPHISKTAGFDQGFDRAEHPWSDRYRQEAIRIVRDKIRPDDRSSELPEKIRAATSDVEPWAIKASGALAGRAAASWLRETDRSKKPFFVFLNYMEAHRPYIPPLRYRRRLMPADDVNRSYRIDRSWTPLWSYTFGLYEYDETDLRVMASTYDACIAELDDHLRSLVDTLGAGGWMENTIVALTSDHGEHLGEHHILDHQYSLFEPLLRVPLVLHNPKRVPPGRDDHPVMTHDLFGTLLSFAGVEPPAGTGAAHLFERRKERIRLAESTGLFVDPFADVAAAHPEWDPAPWTREIRALYAGPWKLIRWSDGTRALYRAGPGGEEEDLAARRPKTADRLEEGMTRIAARSGPRPAEGERAPVDWSAEEAELLRALGYLKDETKPPGPPPGE